MPEITLFAIGCGVTFLFLAGAYLVVMNDLGTKES